MNKFLSIIGEKKFLLLFGIVILSLVLRLHRLSELPISPYWDEVSIGYNAYSISQTLNDEYGKRMPLLFRAYDDYKLPAYIYLDSIFVKVMGLNVFSVRLPSAIFGTLTVVFVFFFIEKIFEEAKTKIKPIPIALLGSLLLAISPWHIQFSRGGFEANLALFFIIMGLFFFSNFKKGYKFLILSTVSFGLAFYTYRSVYLFLPILMVGLLFFWRKELVEIGLKKISLLVVLFLMLVFPIVFLTTTTGGSRISQTSISNEVDEIGNKYFQQGKPQDRRLIYTQVFLKNYLYELSPSFLFFKGDPNGRHSTLGMGQMYLWEIPFLLMGVFYLLYKLPLKIKGLLIIWLIAFPVPVALTTPSPHALRGLNGLPALEILVAVGIYSLINFMPKKYKKISIGILVVVIVAFILRYGVLYKVSSIKTASDWGDGYRQLYQYLIPQENRYDEIVVSGYHWQPYMYGLFYKVYSPSEYQKNGNQEKFGKYYFGGTSWDKNVIRPTLDNIDLHSLFQDKKVLIALSQDEYDIQKKFVTKIHEIKSMDNKVFLIIARLN